MRARYQASGLILLIAVLACPLSRECAADVTLLGRWAEGPCFALAVDGDVVYGANGAWLEIVDFSPAGPPALLGRCLLPGPARDVSLENGLVAVASGNTGLRLLDATDPAAVHEVGSLHLASYAGAVALDGDHAYLAMGDDGLLVVDVADPAAPFEVGALDTPGHADGVLVDDGTAYVSDGRSLRIVDVSVPSAPVELGSFLLTSTEWETLMGFDVVEAHAYLVTQKDYSDGSEGLRIVDLADPAAPVEIGYLNVGTFGQDVAVSGTHAIVATGPAGLCVVDVSDPTAPVLVGDLDDEEPYYGVVVSGNRAYMMAGSDGMSAINLLNPAYPFLAASWDTHGATDLVAVRDDHAYVNLGSQGLHTFDLADLAAPSLIGPVVPTTIARGLAFRDQYACSVGVGYPDLRVLDLAEPSAPAVAATLEIGGQDTPHDIAIAGDVAYAPVSGSHGPGRLVVVDLANPQAPALAGWAQGSNPLCVDAVGDFAYFGDGQGLWILDGTDPQNPVVASTLPDVGHVADVVCDQDLVYLTCPATGLHVVDATNPYAPVEVANLPLPGEAKAIAIHVNVAYIAAGSAGLQVVSLVDPTSPYVVDHHPTGDDASAVTIDNHRVFVADGDAGFWIFMADILTPIPESTSATNRLVDVHPNPFNPQVIIAFELAQAQRVQVAVYDLAGRRLAELASGIRDRGPHQVAWNGRDAAARPAPSGTYLVRIEAEGWSAVRKVTLAR